MLGGWRATGAAVSGCMLVVAVSLGACGSNDLAPADAGADASIDAAAGQDAPAADGAPPDAFGDVLGSADGAWDAAPGDASGPACPPPPPGYDAGAPITVSGTVYAAYDGAPVIVTVTIEGHTTTSATDGTFTIAGVTPPYDALLDDNAGNHTAYLGLTRVDPKLLSMRANPAQPAHYQEIQGVLTSGGATVDAGPQQIAGAVLDLSGVGQGQVSGSLAEAFSVQGQWGASPTASGTLWGFTADAVPGGGTTAFTAIGSIPVVLDGGVPVTGVTVPVGSAGAAATTLSGTVTGSFESGSLIAYLHLGRGIQGGAQVFMDDSQALGTGSFSYGTFAGPLTWALSVGGLVVHDNYASQCAVVRASLAGNETLTMQVPATTTSVTQPPTSGTVPGACVDFDWSTTPRSVYVASLRSSTLGGPYYAIVTDRGSFRAPYPVPSDYYVWDVYEFPQQAGVDAVTASFASTLAVFESSSVLLVDTAWCAAWQGQIMVP